LNRSRTYRTEAIVLKAQDYGEADKLLTLLTPQAGKLRAVAKGVRKPNSRMGGHLDLFTRSNLFLARGRNLDIVTQAVALEHFTAMRLDLARSTYAHYVADLLDGFTVEGMAGYPLYDLALKTYARLASVDDPDLALRAFEVRLLTLSGYRPQLRSCLVCDESIVPGPNRFSAYRGGVICPNCALQEPGSVPISTDALKILRNLQSNEAVMLQLPRLDSVLQREVEQRLREYVVHRLESRPRSLNVLERLRVEGAVT